MNQVRSFDLASTFKVVEFMSKNSNSVDLLIIDNGSVISHKTDNKDKKQNCKKYLLQWIHLPQLKRNKYSMPFCVSYQNYSHPR